MFATAAMDTDDAKGNPMAKLTEMGNVLVGRWNFRRLRTQISADNTRLNGQALISVISVVFQSACICGKCIFSERHILPSK